MPPEPDHLGALREMWRREVEAAGTYRILAERETDQNRRNILLQLAECEDRHAASWSERIQKVTGHAPDPSTVRSSLRWIEKFKDQSVVLHRLEQEESRVEEDYGRLMGRLHDPVDRQIAEEAMDEERDHATTLRMLAGPGAHAALRAGFDSSSRALARARHRLDRRRHLRRERRPRRGVRHRVRHGRLHGRQRSGARGGAGGHDGQRAVHGRRRVSGVEIRARGLRVGSGARESRDPGGSAGRAARAGAVLSAQGTVAGRSGEHGGAAAERAQAVPARAGARRARPLRRNVSESDEVHHFGHGVHGHRRVHPDHPVLFHHRHAGRDRVVRHQHAGALRGGRVEGAHHDHGRGGPPASK